MVKKLPVSICVPAYNEEFNIEHVLLGLANQETENIEINKIIVVSSGSTDNTCQKASDISKKDTRIEVIEQKQRAGKAAAINRFLKVVNEPVVVVQSADTIPQKDTIEKLCYPLKEDSSIGMTGGAPYPLNDPETFLGFLTHTWWWFHRNIPRFGEIIAFRNILERISENTAVDEAYIQAKLIQMGYNVVHINDAVVKNKGAETIADLIKQRRRIYNGHSRLFTEEKVKIDNMTKSTLKLLLFKYEVKSLKQLLWLTAGIGIELYAQILGRYDSQIQRINPVIWDIASTTKRLRKRREIN